MTKSQHPVGTE